MENEVDEVKKQLIVEAQAKNISHNVRCTECGSQSIEDSQADMAILLRKVLSAGAAAGVWACQRHKAKNNVQIMVLNLVRSVPLTPNEKQTMLDLLKPPPQPKTTLLSMWRRRQSQ